MNFRKSLSLVLLPVALSFAACASKPKEVEPVPASATVPADLGELQTETPAPKKAIKGKKAKKKVHSSSTQAK